MRVRVAVLDDAPAMGRVMVESWLSAHRGQVPDAAFRQRVDEWTPDVSAAGWARTISEQQTGGRDVLLVAEDGVGELLGVVLGTEAEDDGSGAIAQVEALYVRPGHQGRGIGRMLLEEAAAALASLGFSTLHIGVLTANLPARRFYEAMGGREVGRTTFDEEGHVLPGTVYAWPDIAVLIGPSRASS